ncbi:Gibberellin receptor GID1B-like protein [Drosera capensis]
MAGGNEINTSECKRIVPLNTWILISNFKLSYNLLRRPDGTFNRDLNEFLDRKVPANTTPVDGVFCFDIVDKSANLLNRVYQPASENEADWGVIELEKPLSTDEIVPVIVFFHGGSFTHSSANSAIYDTFCRRLVSNCKAVVVSVNYHRSPEHRYPCAYEDGWSAVKWVSTRPWLQSGKEGKVHVYMCGDSSGGNIAHHVAVKAAESDVEVLGNILLHPMFGGQQRMDSEKRLDGKYFVTLQDRDWYWRAYLPPGEDRDHPACNIFGPRGKNIEGIDFPKSLVVVCGLDLVQDWQLAYVEGLKKSGHQVKLLYLEKATIGFYFLPNNDHFYTLMEEIKDFVHSDSH